MSDTIEEIRDLKIDDRIFQVSNFGKVFWCGKEIRQRENADGYLVVTVNTSKCLSVHRMVAMAFIPNANPEQKKEVNHIDFNRKNNLVTNLEWVTHQENIKHSAINGRYKMNNQHGENNPNFGNRKLSQFYRENPDVALEKQSRKGTRNGRATKIELYKDGIFISSFDYIGDCCEYLHQNYGFSSDPEVIRLGIRKSIKYDRPYKGFTFKK